MTPKQEFDRWWRAGHMAMRYVGSDPYSAEQIWNAAWDMALRACDAPVSATRRINDEALVLARSVINFHKLNRDGFSGRRARPELKLAKALLAAADGRSA